ncbi:heterokaryon incompatibility protein-domain-containing protein [Scleroderma yunnanense]
MHLINVQAFIERERKMRSGWPVNRRMKVLEFRDDHDTDYAVLSHRWADPEVSYDEMIELAKMEREERDEIRQRGGYRKILASCEQAQRDKYEWLWVDTCCINKQSSAELSEAINSMYRWYQNSSVCYAYLHDFAGSSFPTERDAGRYPNSDGRPEWFSRGWTLQEMIAPGNIQFFNQHWQPIGDKRTLALTLSRITGIMSWAANRTTTRVEDRAYSLLGLLNVNMPMLYGEGKRAFHRLQLEIIRVSNDQSIFAWGAGHFGDDGRTGSILADDPSFFRDCGKMKRLMDRNKFIEDAVKEFVPEGELHSVEDHFGVFPVTNRGIQIWMLLIPLTNAKYSVFEAWLPCHDEYDDPGSDYPAESTAQYRQVYLRYQDLPHSNVTFEIDDSAVTNNGFTHCATYQDKYEDYDNEDDEAEDEESILIVKMTVALQWALGQCFGTDWMHVYKTRTEKAKCTRRNRNIIFCNMLQSGPDHARSIAEARYQGGYYGCVWVKDFRLPGSIWTIRISCVVWDSSNNRGVKIDIFRDPHSGPENWIGLDVEGADDPNCDMQGLMMKQNKGDPYGLRVDGVNFTFSRAPDGTKVGDYGYLTDYEDFCCEGNVFDDLRSLPSRPDITPRKDKIRSDKDSGYVEAHNSKGSVRLYDPIMWSLPSNDNVNTLLASLSTRFINGYLVTRVIECPTVPPEGFSNPATFYRSSDEPITFNPLIPLCDFAKPFIWYRHEIVDSVSEEWSDDDLVSSEPEDGHDGANSGSELSSGAEGEMTDNEAQD